MTEAEAAIARKSECLRAAHDAVCGDRQLNYGTPEDNFSRIAHMWNGYLAIRQVGPSRPLTPVDVAMFNILLKMARLANNPAHRDSWIDIAGYAACGFDITNKPPRTE